MCFEIFGFDIILDTKLKPWLLEVNHTPSFTTDTPLDYQIKKHLILDTLILLNIKNKDKKKYNESKKGSGHSKKLEEGMEKIDKYQELNSNGFLKIYPCKVIYL